MKYLLLLSLMCCSGTFAQTNDSMAIAQLIINDYKTFNQWDHKQHQVHCLPHYHLIENGAILNLQDEVDYFKKNAHRNINRKDSFHFSFIRIQGNVGYALYKLESTIEEDGKLKHYKWTETAVCEKTNDGWKLALIHSTLLN